MISEKRFVLDEDIVHTLGNKRVICVRQFGPYPV